MADTMALTALYNAVVSRFSADSTGVTNLFGWRRREEQLVVGRRIIWVPGDDSDGSVGIIMPPRKVETPPRQIASLDELVTVYVHSEPALADAEDEAKCYYETRLLFDAWYRAVYLFAYGSFTVLSLRWLAERTQRHKGATIRCLMSVSAAIPDRPLGIADPIENYPIAEGLNAEIAVQELDIEQQLLVEIPEEIPPP